MLQSWLQVSGATKSQLAAVLGVSKGRVSQLFHSDIEPSAHLIAKLLEVTRLPFERLFRIVTGPARTRTEQPVRVHRQKLAVSSSSEALS